MNKKVNPSTKLYQEGQPQKYCPFCGEELDLKTNPNKCWNCQAPINKYGKLHSYIKNIIATHTKLYLLTATMILLMWMAITGWVITNYEVSWLLFVTLSILWICFVPAYRFITEIFQ